MIVPTVSRLLPDVSTARLTAGAEWLSTYSPYGYYRPLDIIGGADSWIGHSLGLAATGALLAYAARHIAHHRRRA